MNEANDKNYFSISQSWKMKAAVAWLAALAVATVSAQEEFRLRILHTNDLHARFDEVSQTTGKCREIEAARKKCYGGFARVEGAIKQEIEKAKKENISILSLNAGDTYQGTVWFSVYKWKVASRFMEMLTIDAMSLGNHEFDDGVEGLAPYIKASTIPILAANVDFSDEPEMHGIPVPGVFTIEREGRKIGIIGYITPETVSLSNTGKVKFRDEIEVLQEEAARLTAEGVDIIIALGHSGYDNDIMFAKQVPDLDVIVGGHSHTFLYTGSPPDSDSPVDVYPVIIHPRPDVIVAMVQAFAYSKYLGKVDLWFDKNGRLTKAEGNPILLDHKIPQDLAILKEIKFWSTSVNSSLKEEIGKSSVFLDGSSCRFFECNLGNLITDAYIHYGMESYMEGRSSMPAGIAIQQGGGIRNSINPAANNGSINMEDCFMALPFFGSVSLVEIQGSYIMEALEWSVARYDSLHKVGRGEFLQVSGMKVSYNLRGGIGNRVISAWVRHESDNTPYYEHLNLHATYHVIMPTFLLRGGDRFNMFKDHGKEIYQYDLKDTEILVHYTKKLKYLFAGLEDRIKLLEGLPGSGPSIKPSVFYILLIMFIKYF